MDDSGDFVHSTPIDSDCDGWSDFDEEILRGTDPYDFHSTPAARHLYEVERLLSGTFFQDANHETPLPSAPYKITQLYGTILINGQSGEEGSYGPLRIPAGDPSLIGIWGSPHKNFSVKQYIPEIEDPRVQLARMLDPNMGDPNMIIPNMISWNTPDEWEAAYINFLAGHLLQEDTVFDIDPLHIALLALAERQIEYLEGFSEEFFEQLGHPVFIFLGDLTHTPSFSTDIQWQNILAAKGERINDQIEALEKVLEQPCHTLLDQIQSLYQDLNMTDPNSDENPIEQQVGRFFQGVTGRYLAALLLFYRYDELESLPYPICDILDPWADPDGDGLSSFFEITLTPFEVPALFRLKSGPKSSTRLTFLAAGISDPFLEDTDGDGLLDGEDNCPSMANTSQEDNDLDGLGDICDPDDDNDSRSDGLEQIFTEDLETFACMDADNDKDGICNIQDNCIWIRNPRQIDTDLDGKGDACDTDDDNDGLPDEFERYLSTSIFLRDSNGNGIPDSQGDADNDNCTNLEEYLAGLDPLDPNSLLAKTVNISLTASWSMISLPISPSDSMASTLFPEAIVIYHYQPGVGYVRIKVDEKLRPGRGYWILLPNDQNYSFTGLPINFYNYIAEKGGWSMIGGCTYAVQPSTDFCEIGIIYGYEKGIGYKQVLEMEGLLPGKGYWILFKNVSDQCELTVQATKR